MINSRKKIDILLVSGCILFAFFWHFSSLTTISLIKKKAMDSGRITTKKTEEKKKKHEMQYFLWIIYQFWGFFLLFCREFKDFYKQRFIFFSLFITVLFSVFSYPFGNDYYNGFFTINYMIDFSGQFCQAKVLNEIFLTVSQQIFWNYEIKTKIWNQRNSLNFSISNILHSGQFSLIFETQHFRMLK